MIKNIRFIYEIMRNGVVLKTVNADDGGRVLCDSTAEIKRSISCNIQIPPEANMLTDQLRVSVSIDGIVHRIGTFVITTMPRSVDDYGRTTYSVEGYDRSYIVYRKKIESRAEGYIAAGTNYVTAIKSLLVACGISDITIPNTTLTLSSAREDWDVGTSYLTIINTLLSEINYTSLWFDSEGFARSDVYQSPTYRNPKFSYFSGRDSIIMRSHSVSDDTFSSYNVFAVKVSNIDNSNEPIYVTSVNNDPSSKLSTVNRGRIQAPVTVLASVSDTATAQAYADNLKFKSMMSTETATIQTAIDAGHEVFDICQIQLPELEGKFEEVSWTISLSYDGQMTHKIRRAVYV